MEEIISELSGSVLRVQLNRPSKKNAMTAAMYAPLAEELVHPHARRAARVKKSGGKGISLPPCHLAMLQEPVKVVDVITEA